MNRKAPVRLRLQRYSLARSHSLVQHRRVDREDRPLPSAEVLADQDRPRTRSVTLSSRRLGLVAKIDMVESDGETVVPVDYKRGKRPHVAAGAYEPERVQICVQGLLLEENGHRCTEGALYFAESRERVRVVFDEELRAESPEERASTKGNPDCQSTYRTQCRASVPQAAARIRKAFAVNHPR